MENERKSKNRMGVMDQSMSDDRAEEWRWNQAGFSVVKMGPPPARPLFSQLDYAIVSQAILSLSRFERELVIMKFWKGLDSPAIAEMTGVDLRRIDSSLEEIYAQLRRFCINHRCFTRSEAAPVLPQAA